MQNSAKERAIELNEEDQTQERTGIGSRIKGYFVSFKRTASKINHKIANAVENKIVQAVEALISLGADDRDESGSIRQYREARVHAMGEAQSKEQKAEQSKNASAGETKTNDQYDQKNEQNKEVSKEDSEDCSDSDGVMEAMLAVEAELQKRAASQKPAPKKSDLGLPLFSIDSRDAKEETEEALKASRILQERVINDALAYIAIIFNIVKQTIDMKSVVYAPILILFHMKRSAYKYPEGMARAEHDFHLGKKNAENEIDGAMSDDEIKSIAATGLEPTFNMDYWMAADSRLNKAYKSLFATVIGSIFEKNKKHTKTRKSILFYGEVLKYVRNTVSCILSELDETMASNPHENRKNFEGFMQRMLSEHKAEKAAREKKNNSKTRSTHLISGAVDTAVESNAENASREMVTDESAAPIESIPEDKNEVVVEPEVIIAPEAERISSEVEATPVAITPSKDESGVSPRDGYIVSADSETTTKPQSAASRHNNAERFMGPSPMVYVALEEVIAELRESPLYQKQKIVYKNQGAEPVKGLPENRTINTALIATLQHQQNLVLKVNSYTYRKPDQHQQ